MFVSLDRGNFFAEEIIYAMLGEEIDVTFKISTLVLGSSKISEM